MFKENSRRAGFPRCDGCLGLHFGKVRFVQAANGANPVVGNILKRGARGNAGIRVTKLGVVYIAAYAFILTHKKLPFPP